MPASFIAIVFVAVVLIVNWRLLLLVALACLVALIAFGVGVFIPEQTTPPTVGIVRVDPASSIGGSVGQPPR